MREIAGGDSAVDRAPRNCGAEDEIYVTLDQREMATILAALRLYEDCAFGRVDERPQLIQEIASDGDAIAPLNNIEVGALCERINCDPSVSDSVRAAAPEMLKALKRILAGKEISDPNCCGSTIIASLDGHEIDAICAAAIAKAEGRT